jgi:uncharacterized integral membrane protein
MKRLSWIVTVPLTAVLVVFAIANRQWVTVDLWPLEIAARLPLFLLILGSLFVGVLAGGAAAWLSAGRTRRRGREAERRRADLEREVARLKRERERAEGRAGGQTEPPGGSSARVPAGVPKLTGTGA